MNNKPTEIEMRLGLTSLDIAELTRWANEIQGGWDGDNPGLAEDKAHCASEIVDACEKIGELLDEMQSYYA